MNDVSFKFQTSVNIMINGKAANINFIYSWNNQDMISVRN